MAHNLNGLIIFGVWALLWNFNSHEAVFDFTHSWCNPVQDSYTAAVTWNFVWLILLLTYVPFPLWHVNDCFLFWFTIWLNPLVSQPGQFIKAFIIAVLNTKKGFFTLWIILWIDTWVLEVAVLKHPKYDMIFRTGRNYNILWR